MWHKPFVLFGIVLLGVILQASFGVVNAQPAKDGKKQTIFDRVNAGESLIVRLKSVSSPGEYLYAAKDSPINEKQYRGVYTWRDTKKSLKGRWADWKITGVQIDGKLNVQLENVRYFGEFLIAPPSDPKFYYNDERRYSVTLRDKLVPCRSGEWFMDAIGTAQNPERYTFTNVRNREYLYAGDRGKIKDESRRYVYTWMGDQAKEFQGSVQHHWDLEEVSPDSEQDDMPN